MSVVDGWKGGRGCYVNLFFVMSQGRGTIFFGADADADADTVRRVGMPVLEAASQLRQWQLGRTTLKAFLAEYSLLYSLPSLLRLSDGLDDLPPSSAASTPQTGADGGALGAGLRQGFGRPRWKLSAYRHEPLDQALC